MTSPTLKIKDIRQYRTFYKSLRPVSPDLDEHFIGNYYDGENNEKRKYGWFTLYHGDKDGYGTPQEGIGNFLQSFLDMAKDGQAVYEFLQNAVDAKSTHFTMVWGKDKVDGQNYVLVANNGDMFDFESVRSILNVGSSTKTADSQNIGKFGIGFKLAHRLVGKENGLDELLSDDPSGPILFSWKNHEVNQLASFASPEPEKIDFKALGSEKYQIMDDNPWLFKILITCFPSLPENSIQSEEVKLTDGQFSQTPTFKNDEYLALCRWVKEYNDIFNFDTYQKGSMFFIKLGTGKENDLTDKNLAEGIRFSLAVLLETSDNKDTISNVLETVQINRNKPITRPDLQYMNFKITKNEHLSDYLYVRFDVKKLDDLTPEQKNRLDREDDIEVLLGYREHNKIGDYFRGAPNFYLYFPLSEEVHNFNFILHSNAFYKASSRTFLHKGTVGADGINHGINERLLRTIAKRLKSELASLFNSGNIYDKENFLHLYAALLTSKESSNYDRQWVKEPFINELTETLKACIPIRTTDNDHDFQLATNEKVYFKNTAINIDLKSWDNSKINWFYWGNDADLSVKISAESKLEIKSFDIFELLQRENVYVSVNEWIDADRSRAKTILNELNLLLDRTKITESFKRNLSNLKFFEFSDGSLFSIDEVTEIQDQGYIILHNKLDSIKTELQKCGIKTTLLNLDDFRFYENYNSYLSMDSQLRGQEKLIGIFSAGLIKETSAKLSKEDKLQIFRVFRDMIEDGKRISRLKELKLFENRLGEPVYLRNLLAKTDQSWLNPFVISGKEYHSDLDRYLLSNDNEVYENIIYLFWGEIAEKLTKMDTPNSLEVIGKIISYYRLTEFSKTDEKLLSDHKLLFFDGKVEETDKSFYLSELVDLPAVKYAEIQRSVKQYLDICIPDQFYIEHYEVAPFKFDENADPLQFEKLGACRTL